jgi:hypothetical protein
MDFYCIKITEVPIESFSENSQIISGFSQVRVIETGNQIQLTYLRTIKNKVRLNNSI